MLDPFEVRVQFSNMLANLSSSLISLQKAAKFALAHAHLHDDLHSCIIEQLSKGNTNVKCNIFSFLGVLLRAHTPEHRPGFIEHFRSDVHRIVHIATSNSLESRINAPLVLKAVQDLQADGFISSKDTAELCSELAQMVEESKRIVRQRLESDPPPPPPPLPLPPSTPQHQHQHQQQQQQLLERSHAHRPRRRPSPSPSCSSRPGSSNRDTTTNTTITTKNATNDKQEDVQPHRQPCHQAPLQTQSTKSPLPAVTTTTISISTNTNTNTTTTAATVTVVNEARVKLINDRIQLDRERTKHSRETMWQVDFSDELQQLWAANYRRDFSHDDEIRMQEEELEREQCWRDECPHTEEDQRLWNDGGGGGGGGGRGGATAGGGGTRGRVGGPGAGIGSMEGSFGAHEERRNSDGTWKHNGGRSSLHKNEAHGDDLDDGVHPDRRAILEPPTGPSGGRGRRGGGRGGRGLVSGPRGRGSGGRGRGSGGGSSFPLSTRPVKIPKGPSGKKKRGRGGGPPF